MLKLRYMLFAVLVLLGGYLVGGIVKADHMPPQNGDFESGAVSPWQTFVTAQGTLGDGYPMVGPYDINGNGVASNALQFSVGTVSSTVKTHEGGGVYQPLHLTAGDYNISTEVASVYSDTSGKTFGTSYGARFELMFDGVVLDSHDFGRMGNPEVKYTLLASVQLLADGDHEIRIRITRPEVSAMHLTQMIDNVVVSPIASTATADPAPAPEPVPDEGCSNQGGNKDAKLGSNKGGNSEHINCGKGSGK